MIANFVLTQHVCIASCFEAEEEDEGVYPSDTACVHCISSGGEGGYEGSCHSDIASHLEEKEADEGALYENTAKISSFMRRSFRHLGDLSMQLHAKVTQALHAWMPSSLGCYASDRASTDN